MRKFLVENNLKKIISKIYKRDKIMYESLLKKMNEIITCENVEHYKNLKKPLQSYKRVHIRSSFVLLFRYDKFENKIFFYDFDHHDNIYK
jgi:YafQ family addiction module toxin component